MLINILKDAWKIKRGIYNTSQMSIRCAGLFASIKGDLVSAGKY
jgi:hypothetical protein